MPIILPFVLIIAAVLFANGTDIAKSISFRNLQPFSIDSKIAPPFPVVQEKKPQASQIKAVANLNPAKTEKQSNIGKLKIASMSPSTTAPFAITLTPSLQTGETLNLTGWKLQSRWQGTFVIQKGVSKFHPITNATNSEDIILTSKDTAFISGKSSPLGGETNYKSNKCLGYLNAYYPELSSNASCPRKTPTIKEISYLNPYCQEYILKKVNYSSCEPPNYMNDYYVSTDSQCSNYLKVNFPAYGYDSCYASYSKDSDFAEANWNIYTNRVFGHPLHDVITLIDPEGITIDEYIY